MPLICGRKLVHLEEDSLVTSLALDKQLVSNQHQVTMCLVVPENVPFQFTHNYSMGAHRIRVGYN